MLDREVHGDIVQAPSMPEDILLLLVLRHARAAAGVVAAAGWLRALPLDQFLLHNRAAAVALGKWFPSPRGGVVSCGERDTFLGSGAAPAAASVEGVPPSDHSPDRLLAGPGGSRAR